MKTIKLSELKNLNHRLAKYSLEVKGEYYFIRENEDGTREKMQVIL